MFLVDDILFSSITGFKFILRTLARVAEEQYTDDAPLKEQLLELQVKLEGGELSEEEYVEQEAAILRGLRDIDRRKRELAGVSEEPSGPFSGKVGEGSGASVTFDVEKR